METEAAALLSPCPHCGKRDMVYIKTRAYGWAEQYYAEDGISADMNIDDVEFKDSRTIRCASCSAARSDLAFADELHTRIIQRNDP